MQETGTGTQYHASCDDVSVEIPLLCKQIVKCSTAGDLIQLYNSLFQVGLAVVNGQLYAVGGFDGTAYLKTIEVYDTDQNQWRLCGAMNYRRLGGGVGVMRAPQTENYFW
jgi:hypothetical protein